MEMTKTFDVDQITSRIQALFLSDPLLQAVNVKGEILDLKRHTSGHVYFTLTGKDSRISCVMFRSDAVQIPRWPRKGDEVIVQGRVSVYPPRGSYQFYTRQIYPVGVGAAARAKAELKARLEKEGIFDIALKRNFPSFPRKIAVITSPTGAAVRDVIRVSSRVYPICELLIVPVLVQGASAPDEISAAFKKVGLVPGLDAVLLVRGGGSRDDLNPFDSEAVVRAVRGCPLPVMTGLGHEVDLTLADLAADSYSSTPSSAVQHLLPDISELTLGISRYSARMSSMIRSRIDFSRYAVDSLSKSATSRIAERVDRTRSDLDQFLYRTVEGTRKNIHDWRERVSNLQFRLSSLSPMKVLGRGYITCESLSGGGSVSSAGEICAGERYLLNFSDGRATVLAESANPSDAGENQ